MPKVIHVNEPGITIAAAANIEITQSANSLATQLKGTVANAVADPFLNLGVRCERPGNRNLSLMQWMGRVEMNSTPELRLGARQTQMERFVLSDS